MAKARTGVSQVIRSGHPTQLAGEVRSGGRRVFRDVESSGARRPTKRRHMTGSRKPSVYPLEEKRLRAPCREGICLIGLPALGGSAHYYFFSKVALKERESGSRKMTRCCGSAGGLRLGKAV